MLFPNLRVGPLITLDLDKKKDRASFTDYVGAWTGQTNCRGALDKVTIPRVCTWGLSKLLT